MFPAIPQKTASSIAEAVKVAKQADVIVLAIGGNEQTSREAWGLNHMGDRARWTWSAVRMSWSTPCWQPANRCRVSVQRPSDFDPQSWRRTCAAIFECWYLGQETGQAVAEVLFGDVNPGGKLPISIPRSVGHLPVYYNYKPSARRGYLLDDYQPAFSVRFRPELYDVQIRRTAADKKDYSQNESTTCEGGCHQHRSSPGR